MTKRGFGVDSEKDWRESSYHLTIYVQGDRVWVVGTMEYHTLFARGLGIPVIRARIVSSAVTGYGINKSGQ